jgi:hypothetical protein
MRPGHPCPPIGAPQQIYNGFRQTCVRNLSYEKYVSKSEDCHLKLGQTGEISSRDGTILLKFNMPTINQPRIRPQYKNGFVV